MLSDFRALAELVVSETDKTEWLWVKDALGENPLCKQLKHWVEKYHLFEAWPFYLFDAEWSHKNHLKFYDPSAFGKNRNFLP